MWPFLIPPPLGQPHSVFGGTIACWLFSCFHNPPNSDMDYIICTVRTWSFSFVRIKTPGLGTPTASQHNIFNSENSIQFFLCSWRDSNSGHEMWTLYQFRPPATPKLILRRSAPLQMESFFFFSANVKSNINNNVFLYVLFLSIWAHSPLQQQKPQSHTVQAYKMIFSFFG